MIAREAIYVFVNISIILEFLLFWFYWMGSKIWIYFQFIVTLACLYIIYANQQINIILNFYSIVLLLFLNFFSVNDIYLLSFFIGLIYSGALVVSFLFVLMIVDVNIFNLRNNLCLIWFGLFIHQQL